MAETEPPGPRISQPEQQVDDPEGSSSSSTELSHVLTRTVRTRASELLKRDRAGKHRGLQRYHDWEQQKWKQQHYEYYDDEMFRYCYAMSKLPWSVSISRKALEAVAEADLACAKELNAGGLGVCVGCGPGSDAIALLGHRHAKNPAAPLVLFLIDRCSGWRTLLACVDEHLRECRLPYSLWFKPGCVKDVEGATRVLPEADLVVFSFAHSVNADPKLWPHLANSYKMVLVIDITSEALAETLQQAGFASCHIESQSAVSIFYHVTKSPGSEPQQPAADSELSRSSFQVANSILPVSGAANN